MLFVNTAEEGGRPCATANDVVERGGKTTGGPMLLLNSLLAGRSCVIKRFVLPAGLLRKFSLEESLSLPPNLKWPRMDVASLTSSFIMFLCSSRELNEASYSI